MIYVFNFRVSEYWEQLAINTDEKYPSQFKILPRAQEDTFHIKSLKILL